MSSLLIWYLGAVLLGALFAWVFVTIFKLFVPKGTSRDYWVAVGRNTHGLLHGSEDMFWQYYWGIVRDSAKYVGRQLGGLTLAFAPLVAVFLVLGPWLLAQWDQDSEHAVFPADAGVVTRNAPPGESDTIAELTLDLANGNSLALSANPGGQVVCQPGRVACLILQGFGFTAIDVDPGLSGSADLIIVRTDHNDWNPLWPYLSDPEFLFFISLIAGSILLLFATRRETTLSADGYRIAFTDQLLTQLATHGIKSMVRLGNFETRVLARRIRDIEIDRPIFICGLARSGTTMLLEKLSGIDGVATHRYRDFPFIMTPVSWNRFLSLFATKQNPVERPHQDGIKITRDSPDAFEEPIWQYFFPFVHDIGHSHILNAGVARPDFIQFYTDHIKKILLLRKGRRYLSKGNYNLMRIEYLHRIFPSARFLIPIRHPSSHVISLVRQHQLFVQYTTEDPAVADYLRAVGHYEFGSQRVPVCITEEQGHAIQMAWDQGSNALGYFMQWAQIYDYLMKLLARNSALRDAVLLVRFEDLCRSPLRQFEDILTFCELEGNETIAKTLAQDVRQPSPYADGSRAIDDTCWDHVRHVASAYGYSRDSHDVARFRYELQDRNR